jgi:hypothetical protein
MISNLQGAQAPTTSKPEFFRLPTRGPDPYFGLTRATYYALEKRGAFRLIRLRERGKIRGVTLIPYDVISDFIRKTAAEEKALAKETVAETAAVTGGAA